MTTQQQIEKELTYNSLTWLGDRSYSPTFIARYIIEWCNANNFQTPDDVINGAYFPDWFVRSLWVSALTEIIRRKWLNYADNALQKTEKWPDAVAFAKNIHDYCEASKKAQDIRTSVYAEGKKKSAATLPAIVQEAIQHGDGDYRLDGISIDRRNYIKRCLPNTRCLVEFGRRHFHFESDISKKRETVSGNYFINAVIVDPGKHRDDTATVKVGNEVFQVESWRIARVLS